MGPVILIGSFLSVSFFKQDFPLGFICIVAALGTVYFCEILGGAD